MKVKPVFWDPEKVFPSPELRCPFNRGNGYKDYLNIFPGPNFEFPEWTGGGQKERFH